ncbi:MAG: translocation/assembly module TamB domain-containing protein [Planctomycetota bacterium]|jgi:hypothetical protein
MHTGDNSVTTAGRKVSDKMKTLKWIIAVALVLLLLLFLVVPMYLSSDRGRDFIVGKINESIDGKIAMGDFSMGWFKGIRVTDLSFENEAGTTSVSVREISTKPYYVSLLLGIVALGETLIDEPRVVINVRQNNDKASGSVVSSKKKITESKRKGDGFGLAKVDLTVKGGDFTINRVSQGESVAGLKVSNIESKVDLNPLGKESTFDVVLAVAGGQTESKITAKGNLKPAAKKSWTLKGTSGDFTVKIDDLDLESLGPLLALVNKDIDAAGILNGDITAKIDDGRFEKLQVSTVLSDFKKDIRGKKAMIAEPIKMDAQISSDDKNIIIDKLNFTSSFCTVDCKGGMNSVDYVATADLGGLQEFAGQFTDFGDYKLAGKARESGKISFDDEKITARGQAVIEEFVVSTDKKDTPATSVKMNFDVGLDTGRDILKITSLQTTADMGQVKITDSVVPLGEGAKQELGLAIKADIDLKKAQPFIELFKTLSEGMAIGGKLKSDLSVSKNKGRLRVATDSTSISDLGISQPGRKPFEDKLVKIFGEVLLDFVEKTCQIKDLRIDGSQIDVTGNLTQTSAPDKTKLSGEVQAEYDLAAVSMVASAFIPEGLQMEGKRKSNIKIESEYAPDVEGALLANLNTQAKFGFDKAAYKGLNFGPTEMELKVTEGLLTIEPFSAPVNNGKVNLAAKVNFKEKPMLLETPEPMQIIENVNINDETSRQMLMYLNPIFADAVNVRGVADFHCEKLSIPLAGATRDDLVVVGTVAIDRMRLEASDLLGQIVSVTGGRGVDMTMLPTRFILQKSFLRYDNMQINIGDNPVNFAGVIGLDKRLDMKVTLPYRFGGTTVTSGESAADRITLPIEGTLDNPKINVQKLLESEAIKQGLKLLEKVLK